MSAEKKKIEEKIKEWLETQGYPLEMLVSRHFQERGFRVIQSEYYIDPESGDSREIDVLVYDQIEIGEVLLRLSLIIECKTAKDKPWILFASNRISLSDRARVAQRAASDFGRRLLVELCQREDIQDTAIFKISGLPAYGITQAFTTGHDICHAAVTSVAKATLAEALESDQSSGKKIWQILFPVLVIDGRLFCVHLSDVSEVQVSEVDSGLLLWRNPIVEMPHTIIHVLTLQGLEQFLIDVSESFSKIFRICETELKDVIEKLVDEANRPPISFI